MLRWLSRQGRTLLFLAGLAAISGGFALVYKPAGLISAGVFLVAGVVLYEIGVRGESGEKMQ